MKSAIMTHGRVTALHSPDWMPLLPNNDSAQFNAISDFLNNFSNKKGKSQEADKVDQESQVEPEKSLFSFDFNIWSDASDNFLADTQKPLQHKWPNELKYSASHHNLPSSKLNSSDRTLRSMAPLAGVDGNWKCYRCRNINFGRRTKCNRCSMMRYQRIEESASVPLCSEKDECSVQLPCYSNTCPVLFDNRNESSDVSYEAKYSMKEFALKMKNPEIPQSISSPSRENYFFSNESKKSDTLLQMPELFSLSYDKDDVTSKSEYLSKSITQKKSIQKHSQSSPSLYDQSLTMFDSDLRKMDFDQNLNSNNRSLINFGSSRNTFDNDCRRALIVKAIMAHPDEFRNPSSFLKVYGDPRCGLKSLPIRGKHGNWPCKCCGNLNFPRRFQCNKCLAARDENGDRIVDAYVKQIYYRYYTDPSICEPVDNLNMIGFDMKSLGQNDQSCIN